MGFLTRIFTWWNGHTVGTGLFTWRHGEQVGSDDQGNRYYREKRGPKRWVLYNGEVEASRIPPEWHAWLHYTVDKTPIEQPPVVKAWEKDHQPNLTGTAGAYHPAGSLPVSDAAKPQRDYQAWSPDS